MGNLCYCHFSFRRPKGQPDRGMFSCAFYKDREGKQLIGYIVRKHLLWENRQFVTAVQSYSYVLGIISEMQGQMQKVGINRVMLVTDNSILAKWIIHPKHNMSYAPYMERAVELYRVGGPREIVITVGLCEPRESEKSYKYCMERYVSNNEAFEQELKDSKNADGQYRMVVDTGFRSIADIAREEEHKQERYKLQVGTGIQSL